jgi:Spy/CpxP family protein refolding chaperone
MKSISDWFSRLNNNSRLHQKQAMTAVTTRILAGCVVALTLIVGHTAPAADWSSIALNRAAIQADRQAIVTKFMDLNESQSQAFWPVYRSYRSAVATADDRMVAILELLIERHGVISDREADDLLDQYLTFEQEKLQVRYAYLKQFRKILPFKQVARLFQLENNMDAVVRYELATKVPLVD